MTRLEQAETAYHHLNTALYHLNEYARFHVSQLDTYIALRVTASVRAARNRQARVVAALKQEPLTRSRSCPVSGG